MMDKRRCAAWLMLLGAGCLSACAPEQPVADEPEAATSAADDTPNLPANLANTAWRVQAEDGARYTTYLDRSGTYRDLRNGDPFQTGTWTFTDGPEGGQICFNPDAEQARESCWELDRMRDKSLFVRGPGNRRIKLTRVAYVRPASGEDAPVTDAR